MVQQLHLYSASLTPWGLMSFIYFLFAPQIPTLQTVVLTVQIHNQIVMKNVRCYLRIQIQEKQRIEPATF